LDGRQYANEYVFMFDLTRDASSGLKISSIREFLDSAFMTQFMAGMKQAPSGPQ
jgi:hypothetical protein